MSRAVGAGYAVAWLATAAFVAITADETEHFTSLWRPAQAVATAGAPLLLLVALAWWVARRRGRAAVTLVVAIGWQGARLAASGMAPDGLRSAGLYLSVLVVPALGVLVTSRRWLWGWVATAVAGLAWAATYDPFRDPSCQTYCGENVLAVRVDPALADRLLDLRVVAAVSLATIAAVAAARARRWVGLAAALAVGTLAVAPALYDHGRPDAARAAASTAVLALAGLAIVPISLAAARLQRLVRLRRLAAATLAGTSTSLQDGLRAAIGDPTLTVAYVCDDGSLVTADGASHVPDPQRASTNLAVRGRTVATIECAGALDPAELRDAFGASSLIAAWNEALAADLRHQLAEVTASRRRLLEVGDDERRRLERDLHDGVQQGLLGLLFQLRRLAGMTDDDERALVESSSANVSSALAEVRRLATGLYPAVIERAGLEAGLHSLVEHGMRPVTIDVTEQAVPPAVATTVHAIVAAVTDSGGTDPARVVASSEGNSLRVAVDAPGCELPVAIADRIAALGGTSTASDDSWEVLLPCWS